VKGDFKMDDYENKSNETQENANYGWKKTSPPAKQGAGKKIFYAVIGVLLICAGIYGLMSTIMSVSVVTVPVVTVHESLVINEDEAAVAVIEAFTGFDDAFTKQVFITTDGNTVLESQVPLSDLRVNNISISAAAAEVTINSHNSDSLDISIEMRGDVSYDVSIAGSTVVISYDGRFGRGFGNIFGNNEIDKLHIKVPQSYAGNFDIEFAAGRADVSEIRGNTLDIVMAAGEFNLHDISFDDFELEMAAGSLTGNNIAAADINIEMAAGVVSLIGDLGTTNCEAAAGSIVLDYFKMPDSITIDAVAGSADIFLPADSRFRLNNTSIIGGISNAFGSDTNASSEITISMAMGQAVIHKKP
jgi:hypothetical protein